MIANAAFLAAMVLLLLAFSLLGHAAVPGALQAPHPRPVPLGRSSARSCVVFLNLFALFYLIGRAPVPQGDRTQAGARREAAADRGHDRPRPVGATGGGGLTPCRATAAPTVASSRPRRTPEARGRPRARPTRSPRVPMDGLTLPRTDARERVTVARPRLPPPRRPRRGRSPTVGTFRVVPARSSSTRRAARIGAGDLQRLDDAGPDRAHDDHRQPSSRRVWSC